MRRIGIYLLICIFVIPIVLSEPIKNLNFLFTDRLHNSEPRSEIVVVGIDDKSLQNIGAWPWSRGVFADFLGNLMEVNPSVVGFDVIFGESREGDLELQNIIDVNPNKIVFGSKVIDNNEVIKPVFNVASGYVNFVQDEDGKIRRNTPFTVIDSVCETSFSFKIFLRYLFVQNFVCDELKLRNKFYPSVNNRVSPEFTKEQFKTISFVDVLNKNFKSEDFKNKIVLVGSTAIDLRSSLNDNFTDIFGNAVPGVAIHANIINGFLNDDLLKEVDYSYSILIPLLISVFLFAIFTKSANKTLNLWLFIVLFVILNLILLVAIEFNFLPDFVTPNVYLILAFASSVILKFFVQKKEKEFVELAFEQYMNKKLLNELKKSPHKLNLGGETKEISVLFSDIRGFTSISEKLDAHGLITFINSYLEHMSKIILENEGTIDKYIGDAIMAIWNAPIDVVNHAEFSVLAALAMQESTEQFSSKFPNLPRIKIGIGINTGNVVVGNLGGSMRFDYTVIGDDVNLASRVESLTKKYNCTILVTENTKKLVLNENIKFRQVDEVIVKGRSTPVKVYEPYIEERPYFTIYEKAFVFYQNGDFQESINALKSILEDPVSQTLLERCENLILNPPKDWNGCWEWDEK